MAIATPPAVADLQLVFPGESEMARHMRAFDWAASELGTPDRWPESLRLAVRLCLTSRFPILLWWGPRLRLLFNDACLPLLSERKRARALMQPGREVWGEVWDTIGPMLEGVIATGLATWSDDVELFYDRKLLKEEVFISWSLSPIHGADGRTVEGIFCPCFETTEQVVSARRLKTLDKLGMRATRARTILGACREAAAVLRRNPRDIPFAAIYVGAEHEVRFAAGVLPAWGHRLPPYAGEALDDAGSPWPLAQVLRTGRATELVELQATQVRIPARPWRELSRQALVLPIYVQKQVSGLLVAGLSPRRPLDAAYRTFLHLVAGHIASAISDAQGYEAEHRRAEALSELDRAKTSFFSNVSHEFRTPLALILSPLEDELRERPSERIELAHRNALRLLTLVNTLLDFSRIEAGGMQACFEPVDLASFTAELAGVFRAATEKAGLRLTVDCPPLGEPVWVDRGMWEKIVLNLVSNAFKFTLEGEIAVCLARSGNSVELCVADTGGGIPQQELPRIFERFHRIEGARGRTFEGSGIGLALVQELVKLHGGAVDAESAPGSGSRFTVRMPLGRDHLPPERLGMPMQEPKATQASAYAEQALLRWLPGSGPEKTASSSAAHPARAKILLADDNADLRQYVHRLLSPRHEVQVSADGEAALAAAKENAPDLVLADVTMPGLDGFGLLKALRGDPATRDIPVVLLTARADEASRVAGLERGADDYIVKPFSARELLARVDARLEIARLNRKNLEREQQLRAAAQDSEARMRGELLAELAAMSRLHELGTRLLGSGELQPLLQEVLDASLELLNADCGILQLNDAAANALKIVVHRGLKQPLLDDFNRMHEGTASCRTALERRTRVVVEDVLADPSFAPHLPVVSAAGCRALQSTPLISRSGELLGMLSTHFRRRHRPLERELRILDLYARQAAELVERRQAEEKLRRSEERFRRYFDLGLIGGALTSPEKGILEVNDELCAILGYPRAELLAKTWAELTHPEDLAADVAQLERVLAGKIDGYSLDKRWIHKDGRVIDSIMAVRAVRRADRSVDYFVGLVQDITARKRAEQSLQRLQADLAHVARVTTMGEMASSIAHELNQPLAAIVTNANACARWLEMEPAELQEANAAVTRIVRDAKRASEVMARIRSFVQRREMSRSLLDLAEVAREALAMAEPQIRMQGVKLSVAPAAGELSPVIGDRVHLQQVILNLLKNALEAMEPLTERKRSLAVMVNAYGREEVGLAVRDSGIGVGLEQRSHLFEAFRTTKPGGMGMGLAISRSIVEAHGGRLWATDNDGPGTTFHLALPAAAAGSRAL